MSALTHSGVPVVGSSIDFLTAFGLPVTRTGVTIGVDGHGNVVCGLSPPNLSGVLHTLLSHGLYTGGTL